MSYSQLTLQQRYRISAFRKIDYSQKEIARKLKVSPSSISRELRRNGNLDGHYDPKYAASEARLRQQRKRKYTVWTPGVERYVRAKLKLEWSPEQIAGRMKREKSWDRKTSEDCREEI
nr:helix-turn-helix domain-containing protein [Nitratifractor salsuginis]